MENKIGNIDIDQDNLVIRSNRNIYCESFYFIDVYDDVLLKKFIKSIERLVRSSKEYRKYIELLRTNITALNYDSVMSNLSQTDVSLEFHHYPLTLYENIEVVVIDHLIKKDNITSFSIAKEIMDCHFKNIIGLTPLSKTNHELAHNNSIFIHKNQIYGDYHKFIEKYKDGINIDLMHKIERMEKMSDANIATDFKGILNG